MKGEFGAENLLITRPKVNPRNVLDAAGKRPIDAGWEDMNEPGSKEDSVWSAD